MLFLIAVELALILQHVCNILAPEGLHTNTFLVPKVWVLCTKHFVTCVRVCVSVGQTLSMCVCLYGCVCVLLCFTRQPMVRVLSPRWGGVALIWELGTEVGTHKLGPGIGRNRDTTI